MLIHYLTAGVIRLGSGHYVIVLITSIIIEDCTGSIEENV